MSEQSAAPVDDADAPAEPTTSERLRAAARRARSIWCAVLSGLG